MTKEDIERLDKIAHDAHERFMKEASKNDPDMELARLLHQEASATANECLKAADAYFTPELLNQKKIVQSSDRNMHKRNNFS